MGMRATVIQYSINVRTPKKEKGRTKLEQEQIWNGFKMFHDYRDDRNGSNHRHHRNRIRSNGAI